MDEATLKFKIKQRAGFRSQVTRHVARAGKFWSTRDDVASLDTSELTVIRSKLQKLETPLEDLDNEIGPFLEPDAQENDIETAGEYREKVWDALEKISILLSPPAPDTALTSAVKRGARLPKLEIPTFDGNPLNWPDFWDSFNCAVHDNSELSEIEKFQHLRSILKQDAKAVVDGYRLTEANYKEVIEVLKERFGNEEVIIFAHFDKLLSLPVSSLETNSLQTTYDETERHIRNLVSLGLSEDTFGQVFTPIILSKLPRPVRVELHRKNGSDRWQLSKLRELFREELKARQLGEWSMEMDHKGTKSYQVRQQTPVVRKVVPTAGALMQESRGRPPPRNLRCRLCSGNHYTDSCPVVTSFEARKEKLKGSCFKCLSRDHFSSNCYRSVRCYHCKLFTHCSALCPNRGQQSSSSNAMKVPAHVTSTHLNPAALEFRPKPRSVADAISVNQASYAAADSNVQTPKFVQMQMALTRAGNAKAPVRLYLDTGSSRSYVTTNIANQLKLTHTGKQTISNARFEDPNRRTRTYDTVDLPLHSEKGSITITACITPMISCSVTRMPVNLDKYPILKEVSLADPPSAQPENVTIDILIGGDYYYQIVTHERVDLSDGLVLLSSIFGYVLGGPIACQSLQPDVSPTYLSSMLSFGATSVSYQNDDIERFWSLEDVGVKDDSFAKDDELALAKFNESICFVNGRYEVGWPWKSENPDLPDNFQLAKSRLNGLLKRLGSQPDVLKKYHETIMEQVSNSIVEPVDQSEPCSNRLHYLPHHCVIREDRTTTKLRVVYDASAKATRDSLSLNDCLLRGPVFLQDLCGLLLRFRTHRFAVIADIEKAFLQISIRPSDRDVTRFLWLKNPNLPPSMDNLQVYRFLRVLFGIISSPFLLDGTIRFFLSKSADPIVRAVADETYVDNLISGCETAEECPAMYEAIKSTFASNGMNIREWQSNNAEFIQELPPADQGKPTPKVLGMTWCPISDTLSVANSGVSSVVRTKRDLLQSVSKVFDPCGLLSPVVLRAKILVQQLWKQKIGWDQCLPPDIQDQWASMSGDFNGLANVKIDRFLGERTSTRQTLHCFCDASGKAYSAVVYLKGDRESDPPTLLFSKSKLAPVKPISLPRLELMAVVIGVRLCKFVMGNMPGLIEKVTVWSDSKCVLHWLKSQKVLSVFVSNRVREINGFTARYRYVPSQLNPADLCSRGTDLDTLVNSKLWWSGPEFLLEPEANWPPSDLPGDNCDELETQRLAAPTLTVAVTEPDDFMDFSRFSSLTKVTRCFAFVMRFIIRAKRQLRTPQHATQLTGAELSSAQATMIRLVQAGHLTVNPRTKDMFKKLGVFTDSNGILRCSGRFENSASSEFFKYPILLPSEHPLTALVIRHYHEKSFHAGSRHTLSLIRQRFWIPRGLSTVKSVISKCMVCRKAEGGPFAMPPYGQLPRFRIAQSRPFSHVGVDYLGPLYVRNVDDTSKVWVCLFTCAATRAIHLEVAIDMSTEHFLWALRRFCALYGTPLTIVSDNGTNFVLAEKVLRAVWTNILNSDVVQDHTAAKGINWLFIPEYSPWMGGFYERLIGSVKRALRKTLGKQLVSLSSLQTLTAEISAILNARPLVWGSDLSDPVLTPAHLLGKSFDPTRSVDNNALDITKDAFAAKQAEANFLPKPWSGDKVVQAWKESCKFCNAFWDIWQSDYLTQLRETALKQRTRKGANYEPTLNSTVLIKSKLPRSQWSLGRVMSLNTSQDGHCRSVVLQMPNRKRVVRPTRLLFPIEVDVVPIDQSSLATSPPQDLDPPRPPRVAKDQAKGRIRALATDELSDSAFFNLCSNSPIVAAMPQYSVKISKADRLSRFFAGHHFRLNDRIFTSIEQGTWYTILKSHGMHEAAEALASHPGLRHDPNGISAWTLQIGFDGACNPECILNMDRIYYAVMVECLSSPHSILAAEFAKLHQQYGSNYIRFVCCSRCDHVFSTGISSSHPDADNPNAWTGCNIYGDLLYNLYDNWYGGTVLANLTMSAPDLIRQAVVFNQSLTKTLLFASDSMWKNIKSIRFADILPPISGAKFSTLAAAIAGKGFRVEDYRFIVLCCGTNMCSQEWNATLWNLAWKGLKRVLDPVIRPDSMTRIIIHSGTWNDIPKCVKAQQHATWMEQRVAAIPNITYYNWTNPENNPFVIQGVNGTTRRNLDLFQDRIHVNHKGFLAMYKRMCEDFRELELLPLALSKNYGPTGSRGTVNSLVSA